uniref:Golgi to ER traffic protein 4 homolog isoform X2 n=1 Tax=Rhizophora mucronata TaxID=61149 RepID=A0A2P2LTT0_RHIMU
MSFFISLLSMELFPLMSFNMSMVQLLDEIAEKFYGVQRRNPLQGMFGDIFKVTFS